MSLPPSPCRRDGPVLFGGNPSSSPSVSSNSNDQDSASSSSLSVSSISNDQDSAAASSPDTHPSPYSSPAAAHQADVSPPTSSSTPSTSYASPLTPAGCNVSDTQNVLDTTLDESQEYISSSSSSDNVPCKRRKIDEDPRPAGFSSCTTLQSILRNEAAAVSGDSSDSDAADIMHRRPNESLCNQEDNASEHSSSISDSSSEGEVDCEESDEDMNIDSHSEASDSDVSGVDADSDAVEVHTSSSTHLSDESVKLLYPGSHLTVDEGILKVLKLYIKERWTKNSLQNCLRVITSLLPKDNDLPPTSVMLLKRLAEVAPFESEKSHYYCSSCQDPVKNSFDSCTKCALSETDVFFEYPLDKQLVHFFENRALASLIDCHKKRHQEDKMISDVQDGTEYKNIKAELTGEYDVILMLNVDGVSLSKSSKQEVWTILCTICDVPPKLRASYMILTGVYVGKQKPKMNTFLRPFVKSLRKLCQYGVKWTHPQSKKEYWSIVVCPILCADAPAKAICLNVKLFSHRYGCNVCEQKSKKVELTPAEQALNQILPGRKKMKRVRRMIFQQELPLRTGERMKEQAAFAERRLNPTKGVIGTTVLCDLPYFDPASCICAEYLHVVCLGVTKYFLQLMFYVRGPWFLGNKIGEVDTFLSSIKVPDFIKRLPRGISDFKFMIGSELRAFLLFYSLPAFKSVMTQEYFQHWMLLVGSIFILLQDYISEDELNSAEIMLRMFVRDIHDLYGDKYYTYNVHNLLHLCILVRRWGNLWSTSAFDSEKFNGFIVSHVHGTKHIGKELLNNLKIIHSVQTFERVIHQQSVKDYPSVGDFEFCGQTISVSLLSHDEYEAIQSAGMSIYKLYGRAKVKSHVFTSKIYDDGKKRANSYVQLEAKSFARDGLYEYGQILYFVEDWDTREVVCLVDMFQVVHTKIIFHHETRVRMKHLEPVERSNQLCVVPVSRLVTKLIKASDYICLRPNSYEVNL